MFLGVVLSSIKATMYSIVAGQEALLPACRSGNLIFVHKVLKIRSNLVAEALRLCEGYIRLKDRL